uniref:Major sperm protein n=1 Tax=Caenorhabditis japonica TaxID=281687 RepID=A0A8R1HSX3_CAEJA
MLVPLTAIVTSSLPLATALVLCAKDRQTVHKGKNDKSAKAAKTSKSDKGAHGKSSKSGKSRRSSKSKNSSKSKRSSKSGKSSGRSKSRSKRSSRSKKSAKKSSKSSKSKSTKTAKEIAAVPKPVQESKSEKSASEVASNASSVCSQSASSKSCKNRRLDSDAQKKMERSGKVAKTPEAKSVAEEVATIKHSSQLAVAPARLQYQTLGGVNQIELKNTSTERKAYKVKCSDNALYRVNPVFGFAEPKSTVKIDVLRLNGEEKTDKLVLLTANANGALDPRDAFNTIAEHREMMVVPLVAA